MELSPNLFFVMTLLKLNRLDLKEDMVENHFDKNGDTGSSVDSITNIKMRKKQTKVNEENNQKT